jgi:predicted CxxxxCH...CXXCH cytochrome family protein
VVDCNTCHGATATVTTGPDREPIWGNSSSVDCTTCHTGSAIATIGGNGGVGTYNDVDQFYTTGHGDAGLVGAPDCTGCHALTYPGHLDGDSTDDLLTGAAATNDAFCQSCHTTYNSHFADSNTPGGGSTDGNACAVCHNPHGENMGTNTDVMLIVGTNFTDRTDPTNYFDGTNTGVCQVCHVASDGSGGVIEHYNQTLAPDGHNASQTCTDCHTHDNTPSFAVGAGTNCGDCHGQANFGAPSDNTHTAHVTVIDGDILNEDRSDCAYCHIGADLYTYDYAADQSSGTPGRENHGAGDVTQKATLAGNVNVGYNTADLTCTSACHTATVANGGVWANSTQLACDACHGNPPADGGLNNTAHDKHVALAGVDCTTCHDSTMPTDTSHITSVGGADDAAILVNKADAQRDEALILEASWNATDNTCNNTACHNPGAAYGTTNLADWDDSESSCDLCHGGTDPGTNEHTPHVSSGITINCADCHTDPGANMAHRDGTVDVNGAQIVSYTAPDCTNNCHILNGVDNTGSTADDADWTAGNNLGCADCHTTGKAFLANATPPGSGLHDQTTVSNLLAHDVSFNGYSCNSCHDEVAGPTTTHINGGVPQNST